MAKNKCFPGMRHLRPHGFHALARQAAEEAGLGAVCDNPFHSILVRMGRGWDNWRVYEAGPDGERTYLTSEQIDAARANAKKVMDEFCAGQ